MESIEEKNIRCLIRVHFKKENQIQSSFVIQKKNDQNKKENIPPEKSINCLFFLNTGQDASIFD